MMPGQIPDPSLAAGSLPGLGPLAGISATTLTDQLKLADFRQLGTMLSPLHFLGRLGKRPLAIKTEVGRTAGEDRGGAKGAGICRSWCFNPGVFCRWMKMKRGGNGGGRRTRSQLLGAETRRRNGPTSCSG